MKKILSAFLLAVAICAAAVEPTWKVDFGSVFDNREGDNAYTDTKTFLFTNLAPELGLKFSASDRIAGGVVWHQPIGCEWEGHKLSPTLYYRHEGSEISNPWSFSMGMFPRTQLREELPGFLWSDSLAYSQRNIRGFLIQYERDRGFFDAYVDWRGMQTETQREAFNIVFHGRWFPKAGSPFFVGGHAMMNHFALTKHASEDEHIVDNFVVNPYIGADLGKATSLDSLIVRGGPLLTIERNRAGDKWETPLGIWAEAVGEWKWLGVKESIYAGGRQMPSYIPFRSQLYNGEPFYQAKFYSRTDVYANIYRTEYVKLRASLDFHFAGSSFIFYQRIILAITLPGGKKIGYFHK
jgi:hypothetical protein